MTFDLKESCTNLFAFLSDGFLFGLLVGGLYHLLLIVPFLSLLYTVSTIPILPIFLISGFLYGAYTYLISGHTVKHKVRFLSGGVAFSILTTFVFLILYLLLPVSDAFLFLPTFLSACFVYWGRSLYFLSVRLFKEQEQLDKTERTKTKIQEQIDRKKRELSALEEKAGVSP